MGWRRRGRISGWSLYSEGANGIGTSVDVYMCVYRIGCEIGKFVNKRTV
jgi:hypothetical protein